MLLAQGNDFTGVKPVFQHSCCGAEFVDQAAVDAGSGSDPVATPR